MRTIDSHIYALLLRAGALDPPVCDQEDVPARDLCIQMGGSPGEQTWAMLFYIGCTTLAVLSVFAVLDLTCLLLRVKSENLLNEISDR